MNHKKLGTILVTRDEAKRVCLTAIENVKLYREKLTEKNVVEWQTQFNYEGVVYRIKRIFGLEPSKLSYYDTIKKLEHLIDKNKDAPYWAFCTYCYKSHAWSDTKDNAETILNCCNSAILEPLTIDINIWDDLAFVSSLTKEDLEKRV